MDVLVSTRDDLCFNPHVDPWWILYLIFQIYIKYTSEYVSNTAHVVNV